MQQNIDRSRLLAARWAHGESLARNGYSMALLAPESNSKHKESDSQSDLFWHNESFSLDFQNPKICNSNFEFFQTLLSSSSSLLLLLGAYLFGCAYPKRFQLSFLFSTRQVHTRLKSRAQKR